MTEFTPFTAATILAATEVAADVGAKLGKNVLAITGYNALALQLRYFLHDGGLPIGVTNAYWNAFTNVTHAFIGMYFFEEEITQTQLLGIGFVTLGILLLQ